MKINAAFRLSTTALLSALALAPFADARHEKNLPAETYVVVQVSDVADLGKRLEKHPLVEDVKKANFQDYFAPGIERLKKELDKEKKGQDAQKIIEALKRDLNGEFLFSVIKTTKTEKGHLPYDFVCFADTAADEKTIAELIEDTNIFPEGEVKITESDYQAYKAQSNGNPPPPAGDDEEEQEPTIPVVTKNVTSVFQGVTLHEQTSTVGQDEPVNQGGWALVNKTFVYASAPNVLRELVDAVQNGRKNNFADTALWKRSQDGAGKSDALFVLNAPLATTELRAYIEKETKDAPPNMFGIDFLKAYDSLGLDALEGFWISNQIAEQEIYTKSAISYSEKRGLLSLFTYKPLETTVPSFIPAGPYAFSVIRLDATQSLKNLENILGQAVPALKPMLDMQLEQLKTAEGIDIRGALLENLGENIVMINDLGGDSDKAGLEAISSIGSLYVVEIRDTAKLASLIETAVGKAGGASAIFDEREFMGVKIRTVKESGVGQQKTAYALHDGKLFLAGGAPALIEKVVAELKDPQNPASKDASVQQSLKRVPKEIVSFTHADLGSYATYIGNVFEALASIRGEKIIDSTKKPLAGSLPWQSVSFGQERANELYTEGVLYRKESK